MSSSAFDVVRTTIGMCRRFGSDLISFRASRPSLRGMFRSSRIRPGVGALPSSANCPWRRRYSRSSSPFSTKRRSLASRLSFRASWASMRSSASSSASRIVMGLGDGRGVVSGIERISGLLGMGRGKRDDERRALAGAAGGGDRAAVALDDLTADGEADASPLVLVAAVQALEDVKDAVEVLLLEADPVVGDAELHARGCV